LEKNLPVEDPNSSYLYFIFYILYFLKIPCLFSELSFILQNEEQKKRWKLKMSLLFLILT